MGNNIATRVFTYVPETFEQAMEYAKVISKSSLVPKEYRGKPEDAFIAMQWGSELNLSPLQAMQNIAVINGKPSIWGDAALAIVQTHPDYEWHTESLEKNENGDHRGVFVIKRRGQEPHTQTFSVSHAKKASLWGKAGPWTNYPDRMLKLRARGFALRDKFADALKGLGIREEVEDYKTISHEGAPSSSLHVVAPSTGKKDSPVTSEASSKDSESPQINMDEVWDKVQKKHEKRMEEYAKEGDKMHEKDPPVLGEDDDYTK